MDGINRLVISFVSLHNCFILVLIMSQNNIDDLQEAEVEYLTVQNGSSRKRICIQQTGEIFCIYGSVSFSCSSFADEGDSSLYLLFSMLYMQLLV